MRRCGINDKELVQSSHWKTCRHRVGQDGNYRDRAGGGFQAAGEFSAAGENNTGPALHHIASQLFVTIQSSLGGVAFQNQVRPLDVTKLAQLMQKCGRPGRRRLPSGR